MVVRSGGRHRIRASSSIAFTGNDLLNQFNVEGKGVQGAAAAFGYIQGVTDSYTVLGFGRTCLDLPSGVTLGQVVDAVKKFLESKPEARHLPGPLPIGTALSEPYPISDLPPGLVCE